MLGIPSIDGLAVVHIHQGGADEPTEELRKQLARDGLPLSCRWTHKSRADSHGRINSRAWIRQVTGEADGSSPGDVDGQPGAVLVVGKQALGDDAISKDDQQGCAEELSQIWLQRPTWEHIYSMKICDSMSPGATTLFI